MSKVMYRSVFVSCSIVFLTISLVACESNEEIALRQQNIQNVITTLPSMSDEDLCSVVNISDEEWPYTFLSPADGFSFVATEIELDLMNRVSKRIDPVVCSSAGQRCIKLGNKFGTKAHLQCALNEARKDEELKAKIKLANQPSAPKKVINNYNSPRENNYLDNETYVEPYSRPTNNRTFCHSGNMHECKD